MSFPAAMQSHAQSTLRVISSGRPVAADITGVNLNSLSAADFEFIFDAWMVHHVLRFRGQELTTDQFLEFSARFGELDRAPINVKGEPWIAGYPNLAVMSNIIVDGQPVGSLGYGEAVWHTDMSYN
ncbi:MAG: TauD/TfdA family dioxygenase, partial [Pseudomonadota bacterium]